MTRQRGLAGVCLYVEWMIVFIDAKALAAITVDFAPIKASKIGELAAKFDIVLGATPVVD